MTLLRWFLLVIWLTMRIWSSSGLFQGIEAPTEHETWKDLVFKNLVEVHLKNCQIILTGNSSESSTKKMTQFMAERTLPYLLLDPEQNEAIPNGSPPTPLFKGVSSTFPSPPRCIAVISDVTTDSLLSSTLKFFEETKISEWPYIKIALFGNERSRNVVLTDYFLRNSVSLVFFSPNDTTTHFAGLPSTVVVYGRCFYCNNGDPKEVLLENLKEKDEYKIFNKIFQEMPNDFEGHEFKIVALSWFPIAALEPVSSEPCTETIPRDSVDVKIITEISKILNFRYKTYFPCDNQWGTVDENGNWSGTAGTLQRNMADFSFMFSLYYSRLEMMDYSRPYILEPIVFVARNPPHLPHFLPLIRPFGAMTWVVSLSSIFIATGVLWTFYQFSSNGRSNPKGIVDSLFIILRIFLQEPPVKISSNNGIRMLIGWWWIYCFVVSLSYSSSLVAHLTFPSSRPSINYASELVQRSEDWTWGYEPVYDSGWTWFKSNENIHYQTIFKSFQLLPKEEQLKKVMKGNHAYFTHYFYIRSTIESDYSDTFGHSPIYISKERFLNYGGYGWGFRKGAPFRLKIDKIVHRIIQAGLIDFWVDQLINTNAYHSRMERKKQKVNKDAENELFSNQAEAGTDNVVVLTLDHMKSAFYLYVIGCGLAFSTLLAELLVAKICRTVGQRH